MTASQSTSRLRQHLEFLLAEWLDVSTLSQRSPFQDHTRDTIQSVLQLAETIAQHEFAPHNQASDQEEPTISTDGSVRMIPEVGDALAVYFDSGLHQAAFPTDLGGADLPASVKAAITVLMTSANSSTAGYAILTSAAAGVLVAHASSDLVSAFARPLIEGRFLGTMCLSEPHAGSSLAGITTVAEPQDDGSYRIRGDKMWVSGGDHELGENIVHLVLARTGDLALGVRGLSLFVVPKYLPNGVGTPCLRNDVTLVGLNHKMGNRGTTNAALRFGGGNHATGEARGAVGYLVGERGQGLFHMFHMMNEMRIGVGANATGLGFAGYTASLDYARSRRQGSVVDGAEPPRIIDHPDVRRMLLHQKAYVEGSLALVLYCARLVDDAVSAPDHSERKDTRALLELLTPIVKSFPAQWCLEANSLAIQVHGGYGYSRDFPVEQYYRDNRLNSIHEGTHGIHAIELTARQIHLADGEHVAILLRRMQETLDRAASAGGEAAELARQLERRVDRWATTTDVLRSDHSAAGLAQASTYLEATGDVVMAWLWLDQHVATLGRDDDLHRGKRLAARFFIEHELPRVDHQLRLVASLDRTTLDLDEDDL